ncbi:MAG: SURF1 family protein [Parvibaculales bacterium]
MRRPRLLPTLASLLAFAFLLSLGNWQMARLEWKQSLMARVDSRLQASQIDLPPAGKWTMLAQADYDYRPVRLTGQFDHADELYWYAGAYAGRTGVQVITPFRLAGGGVVLVNRGFVPEALRDPSQRLQGQIRGAVTVSGLMRWPSSRSRFDAPDDPGQRLWFVKDLAAMSEQLGYATAPFFVELDANSTIAGGPVGGQTRVSFSNRHLEYALTWYGLAVTLVIVFILWQVLPSRRDGRDEASVPTDE